MAPRKRLSGAVGMKFRPSLKQLQHSATGATGNSLGAIGSTRGLYEKEIMTPFVPCPAFGYIAAIEGKDCHAPELLA